MIKNVTNVIKEIAKVNNVKNVVSCSIKPIAQKSQGLGDVLTISTSRKAKKILKNLEQLSSSDIKKFDTDSFYKNFKSYIKNLLTDSKGNYVYRLPDETKLVEITKNEAEKIGKYTIIGNKYFKEEIVAPGKKIKFNIDKNYKKFTSKLGILEHGTNDTAYKEIMKNGFKVDKNKFAETFHGVYLTRQADGANEYGTKQIKAICNGDVAFGNIENISEFLNGKTPFDEFLIKKGIFHISSNQIKEQILLDEFTKRGFKGLYSSDVCPFAKCKAVVIFDPKDLNIIKNSIDIRA